ncbi:Hsp20/alpha crystallin family protein [Candidatus Endoriftia persephone]|uniref:HSP20 family protein n=3 Tax=Gammaproteobacteria TaxID=1236 RepID=G2FFQ8_9GAMM|nr:Hsp20/alpha crystallin family protein [Candidatus Endoriftia persephone]EGV50945.1 heat shock protein, Hsp20 family [endosymbiont of Riftia pachyptila (vent Ph05)]EGW54310.1 HSP20 family protein [endosymbiont of Tevnia jerichonana (vent Tica)]USF87012.1 Hsp20/alpha crystallin family protein [Candidatus Endoriftia persephone]
MTYMHYQPLAMLNQMTREMERLAAEHKRAQVATAGTVSRWQPSVDILEQQERFVLSMDLPGVDPNTLEIQVEKGILTVSGERSLRKVEDEAASYTRRERVAGSFSRSFKLPETADESTISAASEHGVLEIVIAKKAEAQPRRIKITH